jgi:hypothetical protein
MVGVAIRGATVTSLEPEGLTMPSPSIAGWNAGILAAADFRLRPHQLVAQAHAAASAYMQRYWPCQAGVNATALYDRYWVAYLDAVLRALLTDSSIPEVSVEGAAVPWIPHLLPEPVSPSDREPTLRPHSPAVSVQEPNYWAPARLVAASQTFSLAKARIGVPNEEG